MTTAKEIAEQLSTRMAKADPYHNFLGVDFTDLRILLFALRQAEEERDRLEIARDQAEEDGNQLNNALTRAEAELAEATVKIDTLVIFGNQATYARDAAVEERDELQEQVWAMDEKLGSLSAHETCACSYDTRDDVCLHHSPKLAKAEAELRRQSELITKLNFLVSLNEEHNGGPYLGYAAQQCVEVMREAAQVLAVLAPSTPDAGAHERAIEAAARKTGIFPDVLRTAIAAYQAALTAKEPTHEL